MPRTASKSARFAARLTAECKGLLIALSGRYGISESSVVEQAVREYAERRNVHSAQPDRTLDTPAPYPGKASSSSSTGAGEGGGQG